MKYCSENEKTHKLIDEELNEAERVETEKHLSVCPECRKIFDSIRQTRALLFAQPSILPSGNFDKKILSLIEKKAEKNDAKEGFLSVFSGFSLKLGFASLVVALALGIAFQLGRMSVFSPPQNDLSQVSATEKGTNSVSATEKEFASPPEKIVTQIKTVTKYVQVPIIKKVKEKKVIYVRNLKNTDAKIPVLPEQKNEIREEIVAKEFNLRDLQPVAKVSYRIIRKGENNEE